MTSDLMTLDDMRRDIAEVLDEHPEAVVAGDNLVDLGIDSIRIMALAQKWSRPGAPIDFADLAEYPELQRWWDTVTARRAAVIS